MQVLGGGKKESNGAKYRREGTAGASNGGVGLNRMGVAGTGLWVGVLCWMGSLQGWAALPRASGRRGAGRWDVGVERAGARWHWGLWGKLPVRRGHQANWSRAVGGRRGEGHRAGGGLGLLQGQPMAE